MSEPLLSVRDLRVALADGGHELVRGVDLELRAGEALALVGPSGAGKTTIAQALVGLFPPGATARGSIRLDGHELLGDERAWRGIRGRRVALVPQELLASLDPVARIGAQLVETLRLHHLVSRAEARRRAAALLAELGVARAEARLSSYAFELSGGERQRVLLALALAGDPEILIADEPTSALDPIHQAELLGLLGALGERRRLTLLVVSHDLKVVARLASRVLVIEDGRVVEAGGLDELLAAPASAYARALVAAGAAP